MLNNSKIIGNVKNTEKLMKRVNLTEKIFISSEQLEELQ